MGVTTGRNQKNSQKSIQAIVPSVHSDVSSALLSDLALLIAI